MYAENYDGVHISILRGYLNYICLFDFHIVGEDIPSKPSHDVDTHEGEGEEQFSQEFEDAHGEGEEDYSQEFEETEEDSQSGNEEGRSTKEEGQTTAAQVRHL